jgi:putrescine aminotransferase
MPLHSNTFLHAEVGKAAEALAEITPEGLDWTFFVNSGAEAVELTIKLARLGGKTHLVAMEGGFHGKTMGALSMIGFDRYKAPFRPLLEDVHTVAFDDLEAVDRVLAELSGECCVMVEPVQGEAGVRIPEAGYLRGLREACDRHGALLALDEIQTGMGRLGDRWWGAEREEVVPDVLLAGKALGGGVVPIGAVVATEPVFRPLNEDPLIHSSTFAGSPLATSAVPATIEALREVGMPERATQLGDALQDRITQILERECGELVREVRGCGLMLGIEFTGAEFAADFILELQNQRVFAGYTLSAAEVAKFTPPAILDEDEIEWLLSSVEQTARTIAGRKGNELVKGVLEAEYTNA